MPNLAGGAWREGGITPILPTDSTTLIPTRLSASDLAAKVEGGKANRECQGKIPGMHPRHACSFWIVSPPASDGEIVKVWSKERVNHGGKWRGVGC